MSSSPYEIKVTTGICTQTVQVSGDFDYAASLELRPQLEELVRDYRRELLFDLDEVAFIDSEGIKTLIDVFRWMREKNGHAKIVRCSPIAMRVFKLAGVDVLLTADDHTPAIAQEW